MSENAEVETSEPRMLDGSTFERIKPVANLLLHVLHSIQPPLRVFELVSVVSTIHASILCELTSHPSADVRSTVPAIVLDLKQFFERLAAAPDDAARLAVFEATTRHGEFVVSRVDGPAH